MLIKLMDDEKFAEWERLLLRIPKLFEENLYIPETENKTCFGAALATATKVLIECGGKIIVQQTALPNIGIGKLNQRGSMANEGTAREQELYVPADSFYTDLMLYCSTNFISVDVFVCATGFCDVGSVGALSRETGGQIYYYSNFDAAKDGKTFKEDLRIDLLRQHVFRAIMAVRCSRGLETAGFQGNFYMNDNEEFVFPVVTTDTTYSCILQHYSRLDDGVDDGDLPRALKQQRGKVACIQMAMLYMTMYGQVRIRVHSISTPVVRKIADVFRCVDVDAVLNLSLKQVALDLLRPMSDNSGTVRSSRSQLLSACVDILYAYRRYCATNNAQRQLVLPEALKLLPLYTIGLLKNSLLKDGVPSDERGFYIAYSMHMTCAHSLAFVHPYLHPMHALNDNECVCSEDLRVLRPKNLELKYDNLRLDGLYIMDCGTKIYVVYGDGLNAKIWESCFMVNAESPRHGNEVELREWGFEEFDPGHRLTLMLKELRKDRPFYLKTEVLRLPNIKDHDQILSMDQHTFLGHLIEDASRKNYRKKSPEVMSYVDFLVHIHRLIQRKFSEDMY